jgi:predicted O-methyltransferase YrrM
MYSSDFFKENTETYNFIYIDGSHRLDDIKIDFFNCIKLIENGGIIWMDDYLGGAPGDTSIRDCIDQLYEMHKDQLQIIHKGYQIAFKKI